MKWIKSVENASREGYKDGLWYPHFSPEGGMATIGYGHKLTHKDRKELTRGVSEEHVELLLKQDLIIAEEGVKRYIGKKAFDRLSCEKKEMLIDFVFNLGSLRGFPKFTSAVLEDNIDKMRAEYKRYYKDAKGVTRELKRRNRMFFNRYLK